MGVYTIYEEQFLPISLEQAWKFISDPHNLKLITPPHMGFVVHTKDLPDAVYSGLIIQYTVSPVLRIPMRWVTEITFVKHHAYFVDEQRVGPYRIWHHEHHLSVVPGGVMMIDRVTYQPPFGILGSVANMLFIRKQLQGIFTYRRKKLIELFGA
jgi:ligand-binding SRPBCC domain-containing protein